MGRAPPTNWLSELTKSGVFKRHNTAVLRLSSLKLLANSLLGIGRMSGELVPVEQSE
jgi:hypothetical protein